TTPLMVTAAWRKIEPLVSLAKPIEAAGDGAGKAPHTATARHARPAAFSLPNRLMVRRSLLPESLPREIETSPAVLLARDFPGEAYSFRVRYAIRKTKIRLQGKAVHVSD